MTTARPKTQPGFTAGRVSSVVRRALMATILVGLTTFVVAAVFFGSRAALGAGVGVAMVCLFFGSGALALSRVSGIAPAASLLIALLTYTLQVVLLGLVFLGLSRSGALDGPVDPTWVAGVVIAGTMVWLVTHIVISTRTRLPLYDLPPAGDEASAR